MRQNWRERTYSGETAGKFEWFPAETVHVPDHDQAPQKEGCLKRRSIILRSLKAQLRRLWPLKNCLAILNGGFRYRVKPVSCILLCLSMIHRKHRDLPEGSLYHIRLRQSARRFSRPRGDLSCLPLLFQPSTAAQYGRPAAAHHRTNGSAFKHEIPQGSNFRMHGDRHRLQNISL